MPRGLGYRITEFVRRVEPQPNCILDVGKGLFLRVAVRFTAGKVRGLRHKDLIFVAPGYDELVLGHPSPVVHQLKCAAEGPPGMALPYLGITSGALRCRGATGRGLWNGQTFGFRQLRLVLVKRQKSVSPEDYGGGYVQNVKRPCS